MFQSPEIYAIINPCAGHGLLRKLWPQIVEHMKTKGFNVTAQLTRKRMHAYRLARDAVKNRAQCIVSVGGEGTFNEIVNGILNSAAESKCMPDLVMIPVGTGTDLSRTLHIPRDYEKAIDLINEGVTKLIDVGKTVFRSRNKVWKRYFVNVFDIGLGGNVVRIANNIPKNLGGFLTFLISSLIALLSFKPRKLPIWIDNKLIDEGSMTIIGVLNGQYFGGGMHAAPMASVVDGILEFIYVKDTNIFKLVSNVLAKVYKGRHLEYHHVYHYQGKELKVKSDEVFLADIDGEEEKAHEAVVTIVPKAIKIKMPRDQ